MKKLFFVLCILLSLTACSQTVFQQVVTSSGVTVPAFTSSSLPELVIIKTAGGGMTLAADVQLSTTGSFNVGRMVQVFIYCTGSPNFDFNGHDFDVFGELLTEDMLRAPLLLTFVHNGTTWSPAHVSQSTSVSNNAYPTISGFHILDETLSVGSLSANNGEILVGQTGHFDAVAQSGDVIFDSAGVSAIQAGVVVNADVNASAAIAWTKLAAGTASYPMVTNGSGYPTTEQYLQPVRGGTGINSSLSTGFPTVSSGSWSVGSITDIRDLHVSFDDSCTGTYSLLFPFAATVTNIEVRVEKNMENSDAGTVECLNNSMTTMVGNNLTAGQLTIASSATTGDGYSSTLTANNTFTAGQRMTLIVEKTTPGGTANIQVTYTRNN